MDHHFTGVDFHMCPLGEALLSLRLPVGQPLAVSFLLLSKVVQGTGTSQGKSNMKLTADFAKTTTL